MGAANESQDLVENFTIIKAELDQRMNNIQEDTVNLRYDYDLILHTNTRQVSWKIPDVRDKISAMFTLFQW